MRLKCTSWYGPRQLSPKNMILLFYFKIIRTGLYNEFQRLEIKISINRWSNILFRWSPVAIVPSPKANSNKHYILEFQIFTGRSQSSSYQTKKKLLKNLILNTKVFKSRYSIVYFIKNHMRKENHSQYFF